MKIKKEFLFIIIGILFLGVFFIFNLIEIRASANWYNSSWSNRVNITIDYTKVGDNLTYFPIYVNLSNLSSEFHTNVNSTGKDIRITASDGTTELPREVVSYFSETNTGEIWFKGNLSSITDTVFWIYYGNPTASDYLVSDTYGRNNVWTDYLAVYHLSDIPTGVGEDISDSSGNGRDMDSVNMDSSNAKNGSLGGAISFNGIDEYAMILVSLNAVLPTSISAYAKSTGIGISTEQVLFSTADDATTTNDQFSATYTDDSWRTSSRGVAPTVSAFSISLTNNTYHHLAGVWYSTTDRRVYVDGGNKATNTDLKSPTGLDRSGIGARVRSTISTFWKGEIDELKLYDGTLTDGWVLTESNNLNSPSTFYLSGEQEGQSDSTSPTYSKIRTNSTMAGMFTNFGIYVNDDTALNPNGQYVFSTNNSGSWVNDSAVNFTATPSWANVTKILNSTVGQAIGYKWYITDDTGNFVDTGTNQLITTLVTPILSREGWYFYLDGVNISKFGLRAANAMQSDEVTADFIAQIPIMKSYGMQSVAITFQGGRYEEEGNSNFTMYFPNGTIKEEIKQRLMDILDASIENDMVIVAVYFYRGQSVYFNNNDSVILATNLTTNLLKPYRNVWTHPNNEPLHTGYNLTIFTTSEGRQQIYDIIKSEDPERIISVDADIPGDFYAETGNNMTNGNITIEYFRADNYTDPGIFTQALIEQAYSDAYYTFTNNGYWFWHAAWHQKGDEPGFPKFVKGGNGTIDNPGVTWIWDYMQELSGLTPPTYSNIAVNDTSPARLDTVLFSTSWTDETALSSYVFSWNGTGIGCDTWENDSVVTFTGIYNWSNVSKQIPATCLLSQVNGIAINIYANDSSNNFNQTGNKFLFTEQAGNCWSDLGSMIFVPNDCQYIIGGQKIIG